MIFALSFIIILSSFIEFSKMTYAKEVNLNIITQLVLMKYPYLIQKTIPFAMFLSCIYCLTNMMKSSELIVARSFGISAWGFLFPILICTLFFGIFMITGFNSLSSILIAKQEKLSQKYIKNDNNSIIFSNSGLWLKEKDKDRNLIIHANSAYSKDVILSQVDFFELDNNNGFINRINAKHAILKDNFWLLEDVKILSATKIAEFHKNYKIPTKLVLTKLQDSFSSPESISIWELPNFISNIKKTGLSATRHSLYFLTLLIYPFFLCSMVLIAASFSLNNIRSGKTSYYVVSGIITGFVIYFFSNIIFAIGASGRISLVLAACAPALITMLIAISLILHSEDG
jgi:lipopolysaccharide export system permease protein